MTDEEMKVSGATQGRWRRIELYAQDSKSPTEPRRSGVGAKADGHGLGL